MWKKGITEGGGGVVLPLLNFVFPISFFFLSVSKKICGSEKFVFFSSPASDGGGLGGVFMATMLVARRFDFFFFPPACSAADVVFW